MIYSQMLLGHWVNLALHVDPAKKMIKNRLPGGEYLLQAFTVNEMVGIIEVAQHAGVSTATVSRALNGKANVSARARERVLLAAQELG